VVGEPREIEGWENFLQKLETHDRKFAKVLRDIAAARDEDSESGSVSSYRYDSGSPGVERRFFTFRRSSEDPLGKAFQEHLESTFIKTVLKKTLGPGLQADSRSLPAARIYGIPVPNVPNPRSGQRLGPVQRSTTIFPLPAQDQYRVLSVQELKS